MDNRKRIATILMATVLLLATITVLSTATPRNVFAYESQATSQTSRCGNDFSPINIGCQNTDSKIQGDRDSVALTAYHVFPEIKFIQNPLSPPPHPEICGDDLDNDGDGIVDEDCPLSQEQYKFVREWGTLGTADGQFENVVGVAINSEQKVYTSNSNGNPNAGSNHRIQVFTDTGDFITKWGTAGSADGQFVNPFGIAFDSDNNVYVVDQVNQRIQKFSSDGQFITSWVSGFNPTGIAIDSSDSVFVTEQFDHRVAKFTKDGILITRWGSMGTDDGQFIYPRDVGVDPNNGDVYVTDAIFETNNYRVQKFTNDGQFIMSWGSLGGDSSPQFTYNGYGIAIDKNTGDVFVANTYHNTIQKFTSTGEFLTEFGSSGISDGQFSFPHDIAFDPLLGELYVADTYNHRIQVFAPSSGHCCSHPLY